MIILKLKAKGYIGSSEYVRDQSCGFSESYHRFFIRRCTRFSLGKGMGDLNGDGKVNVIDFWYH